MTVQCTTDGKRIYAKTEPFSESQTRRLRQIIGAGFRKTRKDWSFPLSIDTCYALRKMFGSDLRVMMPLSDWAREYLDRVDHLEAVRSGEEIFDLPRVRELAPELFKAIGNRSYQLTGVAFGLEAGKFLLGDQPGLGKTLQSLAILVEADARRILVTCPRTAVRTVWENEVARWAPTIKTYIAQGSRADRQKVINRFEFASRRGGDQHMLIVNTEMMRMIPEVCPDGNLKKCDKAIGHHNFVDGHEHSYKVAEWPFLSDSEWDAIVVDESHNSLASTSNVQSKNVTQVRFGAMHVRYQLAVDGLAIAMSGTPFRSRLTKSWGTLNWLLPKEFSSYWRFAETHFGVEPGQYGNEVIGEPFDSEAFAAALRPYYLARTKEEVAPDLPPKFYAGDTPKDNPDGLKGVFIDMDGKQARAYEEMRAQAIAAIEHGSISAIGILAELTRLRQFACSFGRDVGDTMVPALPSNKIDWLVEFLLEREGNTGKVVVASSFTQLIELAVRVVQKELRQPVLSLTGKTTDHGRSELVKRFADPNDPARVAIINSRAGGEAITLDAADDMVFLDLPWTSDEAQQVEDRIHRVSRVHNVIIYRLMSRGTIDEYIAGLTDEQRKALRAARPESRSLAMEAAR